MTTCLRVRKVSAGIAGSAVAVAEELSDEASAGSASPGTILLQTGPNAGGGRSGKVAPVYIEVGRRKRERAELADLDVSRADRPAVHPGQERVFALGVSVTASTVQPRSSRTRESKARRQPRSIASSGRSTGRERKQRERLRKQRTKTQQGGRLRPPCRRSPRVPGAPPSFLCAGTPCQAAPRERRPGLSSGRASGARSPPPRSPATNRVTSNFFTFDLLGLPEGRSLRCRRGCGMPL